MDTHPGQGAPEVGGVGAGQAVLPRDLTRAPAVVGVMDVMVLSNFNCHPVVEELGIMAAEHYRAFIPLEDWIQIVHIHNRTEDRFPDIQIMSRVWTRSTNVMYLVRLVCTLSSEVLPL